MAATSVYTANSLTAPPSNDLNARNSPLQQPNHQISTGYKTSTMNSSISTPDHHKKDSLGSSRQYSGDVLQSDGEQDSQLPSDRVSDTSGGSNTDERHPYATESKSQLDRSSGSKPSSNETIRQARSVPQNLAPTPNEPKESVDPQVSKHQKRIAGFSFFKKSEKPTARHPITPGPTSGGERKNFLAKHLNRVFTLKVEDLSDQDVIIAVMGPTGTGKSSFINKVTGLDNGVGHNLESCTTDISIVKFQCLERSDLDVVFVDTPGFDDTNKTDVEILNMIAEWLKKTYEKNVKLAGILYFHRISDNRMAGTPLKNLHMFEKLCGKNALQNIVLTTTMWDELDDDEIGPIREKELKERYWKAMIDQGSKTYRYTNTQDSAWEIVDQFLQSGNQQHAVLLQEEMVDLHKQLRETKAGQELYNKLENLIGRQKDTLERIRAETKRKDTDKAMLEVYKSEYEDLRKQLEVTIREMQTLKISVGKRLIRAFASSLGFIGRRF